VNKKYFTTYDNDETEVTAIIPKKDNISLAFLKDKFLDLNIDDILILVLIFILLTEDEPDMLTIIALGYIFLV